MHRTILTLALTSFATITAAQDGPDPDAPAQENIDLAATLEARTCGDYREPAQYTVLFPLVVGAAMAKSRNEEELAYAIEIMDYSVRICAIKTPDRELIAVMRETEIR